MVDLQPDHSSVTSEHRTWRAITPSPPIRDGGEFPFSATKIDKARRLEAPG
jgi:hypothetical protein